MFSFWGQFFNKWMWQVGILFLMAEINYTAGIFYDVFVKYFINKMWKWIKDLKKKKIIISPIVVGTSYHTGNVDNVGVFHECSWAWETKH